MARTIGATNKPKLIPIKLGELNKIFGPDVTIMVSKEYENLISINVLHGTSVPQDKVQTQPEVKTKAEVKVIDFNE